MSKTPFIAGDTDDSEGLSTFPDWREGLAILMERAWLGLLVFAVVVLVFVFQAHRQTPYYRSTATLLVEAQIPKILNYQDVLALNLRSLEYFNTHINALHSRKMRENALAVGGFFERPEFLRGRTNRADIVDAAAALFTISPIEKSRLINVSAISPDPQMACDLANALARAYIQQDLDARMNATMEAVEWLRQRSEEYREKLETGLTELQEYREKTGSVSLENDQNIVIEKLKALNSALTSAQTERIQAETTRDAIRKQVAENLSETKLASLLPDSTVQEALQKLLAQQREVAQLKLRYREQHPDLLQALDLETRLEKQLKRACDAAVFALENRYQMLAEREQNLHAALQQQEQAAFDLDRKLVRYNELKRNIEADQEIHQAVIARMKETSIAESLPTDIIRLAEEARPAKAPFRPQPRQALMRGIVFGLIAGLGAIYLFYYADHRFRRNEEVERLLGLSVLATIPLIGGKTVAERGLVCHLKKSGEEAEAFRTLRASLFLKEELRQAQVLMITSASPGEGKSLIASNLAVTLAQDGRRVLLVGGDLRRPALAQLFNLDKKTKGLADVLEGTQPWRAVIQSGVLPGLDVLFPGHTTFTSAELLGKQLFVDFLQAARQFYQHIIIDAPPLLGVSDSLVLLPNMDAVLFVVRYGYTHSLGARHALRLLQDSGTPCFGCIMNGVNLNSLSNYYYYRRYGGYAYRQYQAKSMPPPAGDHTE